MQFAYILEAIEVGNADPGRMLRFSKSGQHGLAAGVGFDEGHDLKAVKRFVIALRVEIRGARDAERRIAALPERMAIALAFDEVKLTAIGVRQPLEAVKADAPFLFAGPRRAYSCQAWQHGSARA